MGEVKKTELVLIGKKPGEIEVDNFISSAPKEYQEILSELRSIIKNMAPDAEEVISYKIPTYKLHGMLVHFTAQEKYCSFIVVSYQAIEKFRKVLSDFEISGTTIHFSHLKPIPKKIVQGIMKQRIKENKLKHKFQKDKKQNNL